jgi:hypothetical protein
VRDRKQHDHRPLSRHHHHTGAQADAERRLSEYLTAFLELSVVSLIQHHADRQPRHPDTASNQQS